MQARGLQTKIADLIRKLINWCIIVWWLWLNLSVILQLRLLLANEYIDFQSNDKIRQNMAHMLAFTIDPQANAISELLIKI